MACFKLPLLWNTYHNIFIANVLIAAGDVSVTWSSSVLPKLYSNDTLINPLGQPITSLQDDILGSVLNIGAILGPWPFGIITDKLGRKNVLLLLAVPHVVAFLILGVSKNIYAYYFARFLAGLALGAGYCLVPLYISEIATSSHRGSMVAVTNIFWCIGDFLSLFIGSFTNFSNFNFILMCLPMIFVVLFSTFSVESPYFLLGLKNEKDAKKSLRYLRSCDEEGITKEIKSMKKFLQLHEHGKFVDLLKNNFLRKNILICMFLLTCLSCSGFFAVSYHLESIFEYSNTNLSSNTSATIAGAVLLVSSFISPILTDIIGRKPPLIASFFGMFVNSMLLGTYFYLPSIQQFKWLPLFCLILYVISFNVGAAIIPWILLSELFPNKFKNTAASFCTTLFWIGTFMVTFNFNNLKSIVGIYGTFYFFGMWSFTGAMFTYFFISETKGKHFYDIQQMSTKINKRKEHINVVLL